MNISGNGCAGGGGGTGVEKLVTFPLCSANSLMTVTVSCHILTDKNKFIKSVNSSRSSSSSNSGNINGRKCLH